MNVRWVRFYATDWRSGCYDLTLEQEGFYVRVCAHYYETGRRLPLDDELACRRLKLDIRMYRRLKKQLLAIGKLHESDEGYYVPRAERELEAAAQATRKTSVPVGSARRLPDVEHDHGRGEAPAEDGGRGASSVCDEVACQTADEQVHVASPSAGHPDDLSGTSLQLFGEVGVFSDQNQILSVRVDIEREEEKCSSRAREGSEPGRIDVLALNESLVEAAGPALDNPANTIGLASCAIPLGWLQAGCDLSLDVVPTLAAIGKLRAGKRVRSWAYFTQAVMEARDARLAGKLAPKAGKATTRRAPDPRFAIDAEAYMHEAQKRVAEAGEMWRRSRPLAAIEPQEAADVPW